MISNFVKLVEKKEFFNYWIFLYSYNQNFLSKQLDIDKIHLFSFSFYTQHKNKALQTFHSHRKLDLNEDIDLELVLNKFKIKGVQCVSEFSISSNTSIICFEVKPRRYKNLFRNKYLFCYTVHHPPSYYIDKDEYLDDDKDIMIPNNKFLMLKLRINYPKIGFVRTNVPLNQIFKFLFNDLFEAKLSEYSSLKKSEKYSEDNEMLSDQLRNMFKELASMRKIENSIYKLSLGCSSESTASDTDDETKSDDSNISFYSYQKKHGLPQMEDALQSKASASSLMRQDEVSSEMIPEAHQKNTSNIIVNIKDI